MSYRLSALVWDAELAPTRKLVALAYANCAHDENDLAWPSVQYLIQKTMLDRKTVLASVTALEELKILTDTGRRAGKTAQVKVYRVTVPQSVLLKESRFYDQTVPETLPNSPVFPPQQSQKRDTEVVKEQVKESVMEGVDASRAAQPGQPPPARKNGKHHHIAFNALTKAFDGITEADTLRWQEAYHLISVPDEIAKLAAWQSVNPEKRNVEKFIQRNLARAQERAESKKERREIR